MGQIVFSHDTKSKIMIFCSDFWINIEPICLMECFLGVKSIVSIIIFEQLTVTLSNSPLIGWFTIHLPLLTLEFPQVVNNQVF